MMRYFVFSLILIVFNTAVEGQSKIKKAEESLILPEKSSLSSTLEYTASETHKTSESGGFFTDFVGDVFVQIFAYTVYAAAFESPFEMDNKASRAFLTTAPYYQSKKGHYTYTSDKNTPIFRSVFSGRYISENSRLKGLNLNLNMRFLKRWSAQLNYLQLWENNPNFGYDNLGVYMALAKYHRVRTEKFDAWWGLGASYVDGRVNNLGFTYGLGAELFFAKPLSVEANFNQAFINKETVNTFRGLLNYHLKRYKFIGGYEHLKIGNQKFSNVTLGLGVFF
ncbi:hypothetical protein FEZ18_03995 [Oceanihabitans sp. IOP_32]|uniref:hypothetical protein n=1 Tax=Oceanihabitans sp. IOP_32 TaxID=2529032 RepID=UPI0012941630|nr:hypothetical protein [Oceanihabitans sp. IOP_32]QFZ54026.1 hypothetical protein FEZ18_03995 [Oceanihabitans sp. IOP_32]